MTSLSDILLDPSRRDQVVTSLVGVIDSEVSGKSGLGGMALKGAYSAVKKINESLVARATNSMLPQVCTALQPFFDAKGDQDFGAYLSTRRGEVADALLAVSDAKAASTSNAGAAKLYNGVRGKAKGHVEEAVPALGRALSAFL